MTSKSIPCPILNNDQIKIITDICFRENDHSHTKTDLIFIFGAFHSVENMLKSLYTLLDNKVSNKVLISGGINPRRKDIITIKGHDLTKIPEATVIKEMIDTSKYKDVLFLTEMESDNTKDNVVFSLDIPKSKMKGAEKLFFICKNYHAGRGYLTLKKYLPNIELYQMSYDTSYNYNHLKKDEITKDNWYNDEGKRNIVWGEVIRIYQYGKIQQDISFTQIEENVFKKFPFNSSRVFNSRRRHQLF